MKKILLSLSIAILGVTAMRGATMEIGYCNGEISNLTAGKVGNCTVSAAVVLTPDMLEQYRGATISGVRLYLTNPGDITALTGWVRSSLEGADLDSAVANTVENGWQTIPLGGGVLVGDELVAVGFSFSQTKQSKCVTLGGEYNENGLFIAKNDTWENIKITEPVNSVCVELVISGSVVPEKDIAVRSLSSLSPLVKEGEDVALTATVRNSSLSTVNGFGYTFSYNGKSQSGSLDVTLQPKQSVSFPLSVPASGLDTDVLAEATLAVSLDGDGYEANNTGSLKVGTYSEAVPRHLLLEEFTTEQCVNCPRAINTIKQAMEDGYADRMTVVAHHVGFYTDWLTLEEDENLLWLYGNDGSFAPAVMLDRTVRTPDTAWPVESIGYYETFKPRLEEAFEYPAFVSLDVEARAEGDEILAAVTVRPHPLFGALTEAPRLTVVAVEDGVTHRSQAGITNPDFTHSHVMRGYFTPFDGAPFAFDGDAYRWEGRLAKQPRWKAENMEVVAFVANYNPKDATDCRVFNSAAAHLGKSSVESVESGAEVVAVEYFDLQGRRVAVPADGIYILRERRSDGSVSVRKAVM